jgi:hypothetical protein
MPKQYWPNSTGAQETPSVGASLTPSVLHSDQYPWSPMLVPGAMLEWSHADANLGGKVNFVATVDITSQVSPRVEEAALLRLACAYVIGRLSGKALTDAFEALVDVYRWQTDQLRDIPSIAYGQRISVANVRESERVPFSFSQE